MDIHTDPAVSVQEWSGLGMPSPGLARGSATLALSASRAANQRLRPQARSARKPARPLPHRGDVTGFADAGRRRAASLVGFPIVRARAAPCR